MGGGLVGIYNVYRKRGVHRMRSPSVSVVKFVFCPGSPHCLYRVPSCVPTGTHHIKIFIGRSGRAVRVFTSHFDLSFVRLRKGRSPRCYQSLRLSKLGLVGTFPVTDEGSLRGMRGCDGFYGCFLFSAGYRRHKKSNGRFS